MADDRTSPFEKALDVFLYAPLGLALTVREQLPDLIAKGRQRVSGQVAMARMIGQFAVAEGERQAKARGKQVLDLLAENATVLIPRPSPPAARRAVADPPSAPSAGEAVQANGKSPVPAEAAPVPPSAELAIHGYDSLSASQVVQRLAGLSREELEAVRVYEEATRARRTILSRIAQLQSAS